ncbi:DNA polymerase III subunit alpha [Anaerococcus vaginalis]|uniref:DNA polymerase III subunit alpha n=1 Tax=Anaerococcus vaginalis TaxID=33037 RepID=UPI00242D1063|nr:DNA polymerase III subunit alpha [Anaerococcus vaginalis]MBS6921349.1 DNA polymerase III subunit alpha [Anaerococcus vaginalis]MDU5988829.1 DNA polymerase III subunit alpha [Anaerococcus vaginalis]
MTNNFTHLHLHTEYSLLDGFTKIDKLIEKLKEFGMDSCAITDHGNMYGVIEFYKKCQANNIKPIIGCEVYICENDYKIKTPQNKRYYHLILLAKNNNGYKNLLKIVSKAYTQGYYYKPRIDFEVLKEYKEDLIGLSACLNGEINQRILENDIKKAYSTAEKYLDLFGKENFYLEVQYHGLKEQKKVNEVLLQIHKDLDIELVCTNDVHYVEKNDAFYQDVLSCIQTGSLLEDENRMKMPVDEFYLKDSQMMEEIFKEFPRAFENTQKISAMCNVNLEFHNPHLPYFTKLPKDTTNLEYLKILVKEGLIKKYKNLDEKIIKRAKKEIDVINNMGYVDYFLIVWDFVKYAKDNKIAVGPGRGSAAGSIVSYALDITQIDPLKYDLLFERFLNPERVSMPDIDIDFCYENRDKVVEYVYELYGRDHVSQIVTFGRMQARNAIRDVGRVMNISYNKVDKIAKLIPQAIGMTIDKALDSTEKLAYEYQNDVETKRMIDTARNIEALPRHTSIHAAGVVISKEILTDIVPLALSNDQIVTQFNMTEIEELGLLKMDFLGLRNLTVIQDTIKDIKKNKNIDIDLGAIDENDPKVISQFTKAETVGIFQFESAGMRNFLKNLKPTRFDDLVAANSLFRPGPMDQIPNYIKNKINPENISYIDDALKPILEVTYGIIVYQEQVMQIVQKLAGFSLGEADNLRRAMSKKKMSVMEANREIFVHGKKNQSGEYEVIGCVNNGISEINANKIYDEMISFAKYAFNKSHSAAYSLVAIQTAFLKYYFKEEYMANLLTSIMGNSSKVYLYISEAKRLGIKIVPPNINKSKRRFVANENEIVFGLSAIKNVGENLIDLIVNLRKEKEFKSFKDFLERIEANDPTVLNKKALESLIKAGVFDCMGYKRSELMAVHETALQSIHDNEKVNLKGQMNLLDLNQNKEEIIDDIKFPPVNEYKNKQKLKLEKEVLGFYISDHPLNSLGNNLKNYVNFTTEILSELRPVDLDKFDNKNVRMAGIITNKSETMTKKSTLMAFCSLEDMSGSIEMIIFPNIYKDVKNIIENDTLVIVSGNLQSSDDELKLIVSNIKEIDENSFKNLYIKMEYVRYNKIRKDLMSNHGSTPVIIYFSDKKKTVKLDKSLWIDQNSDIINYLKLKLGKDNVKLI